MPKCKVEIASGQVFGFLEVVEEAGKDVYNNYLFKCKCKCGKEVLVRSSNLVKNNTRSCGCAQGKMVFKNESTL